MITAISALLILLGVFFFFTATVGLLRMPDFYCRMQATGKGDTLGAFLTVAGLALYNLDQGLTLAAALVSLKLMFIAIFIFVANPTATHSIAKAAMDCGFEYWTKKRGPK
jgi:multicomponent Na+:H+ antiporter subunit G